MNEKIINLFKTPKIIGICGDSNSGKTMLVFNIISELEDYGTFNLYSYGLRCDLNEKKIYSIVELEKITNSIILCDEFFSLFDLEDRKKRALIEKSLRLIYHNNNVLVLVGVPDNFKKFISSKLHAIFYKRCSLSELINGSKVKTICTDYKGEELGSSVLNIPTDKALLYDGSHYEMIESKYFENLDSKKDNKDIIVQNNVEKTF